MCDVIYEDNHLLVVIKPQNVPVQEDESKDEDLLTKLKGYIKQKYNKPGNVFVGLVHRLDRPTGGVMVFARTSKSASRLCEQILNDDFEKTYFAVVTGKPRLETARLTNFLKKDTRTNVVKICTQLEEGAKLCELDYKVLESKDGLSLIKVNLITGRSHQIRVQMANVGCPIWGDSKYAKTPAKGYMALWSTILQFNHPTSNQRLTFKVSPPDDQAPWDKFNIQKYV